MDKSRTFKNRRNWIEKSFKRLGIHNHTRVSAVDAKKLGIYNFTIPRDYFSTHSTNEIACTLSHLKCIEKAYHNKDKIVIICEDDICFSLLKVINKSINKMINNCNNNWEIIQLGHSNPDEMKLLLKEKKSTSIGREIIGEHFVTLLIGKVLIRFIIHVLKMVKFQLKVVIITE